MSITRSTARSARRSTAAVLGAALLVGGALPALADDISNDLDASIDAVAEAMPLNVGGANGTTALYVTPRNGDSKNGCNLTSSTALTLSVSSSNAAVATVSPSSVTFESCSDTKTLTVTPISQGSATVSAQQTSNTTGGTFNLAPAAFNVNVAPPANTAPGIAVAGVTGGASYDKGSVPAATCQVTDAEDGNKSFAATLSAVTGTYASDGIGSQTASCYYKDGGGLEVRASETYSIVDPSAPVIGYTLNPATPNGSNAWYTGNVTLTWSVSEPQSPNSLQKTGCVDQNITADQAATTYTCSATSAGGSAAQQSVVLKRDGLAPIVTAGTPTGTEGTNGWYTSDVDVEFTATDAMSGPASQSQTVQSSGEGVAVTISSPAFSDLAGNTTAAGTASRTVKIDKSAPNAPRASFDPAPNTAGWNKGPVTVTFVAAGDNGPSGIASCASPVTVTAQTSGQTVSGTCTDQAGNVSAAVSVTVRLDSVKPVVTVKEVRGTEGAGGWYTSSVAVDFQATDTNGSGIDGDSLKTVTSTTEGAAVRINSPAFSDVAGNVAPAGDAYFDAKVDLSDPTNVRFEDGPAAGTSYHFGTVPAAPTCTADDAISRFASCAVSGYSTAVGTHTMTATAKDNAGRTATATRSYTVAAWTLNGFYQPVDMGGVWNTVKGGSTVPLKFRVFSGTTELTSTTAIKSFTTSKVSCETGTGIADEIELLTTGGTSLRYDSTGGQFIQNWKTPTGSGCYSATVTTQDGSIIRALFKTR